MNDRNLYGVMAEFDSPQQLIEAARRVHQAGFRRIDAYSPFPIEGLSRALGMRGTRLSWLVLLGGIVGALGGYLLQFYGNTVGYPYDVGGRPMHSWPSFVPVTFELAILCAALAAVLGMLSLNGLPRPYHPVFNCDRFELASRDHFFLCIESRDKNFDRESVRRLLESLEAKQIVDVAE